jgi:hypothetical protein
MILGAYTNIDIFSQTDTMGKNLNQRWFESFCFKHAEKSFCEYNNIVNNWKYIFHLIQNFLVILQPSKLEFP